MQTLNSKINKKLTRQYITDIERTTRLLVDKEKVVADKKNSAEESTVSTIEVAYDQGQIIHGTDNSKVQDMQEIEFEWSQAI